MLPESPETRRARLDTILKRIDDNIALCDKLMARLLRQVDKLHDETASLLTLLELKQGWTYYRHSVS